MSITDQAAATKTVAWIWNRDWFSKKKPILVDGCFYAWKGYWAKTIEKDEELGKYLFNWGYAGPFASTSDCEEWIKSNDAEASLDQFCCNAGVDADPARNAPQIATCQPDQELDKGIRRWMTLHRNKSFPIGNGIGAPWN